MPVYLPPDQIVFQVRPDLVTFIRRLASMRWPSSSILTSWWRSVAHNRDVGGDERSQHLIGTAWDVASNDPSSIVHEARARGLIAVQEAAHVHLQLFSTTANPVALGRVALI